MNLLAQIAWRKNRLKDHREDFAHSVLASLDHTNGVYKFVRIDAKNDGHEITDWEFDVRSLDTTADEIGRLIRDAQDLVIEIAKALARAPDPGSTR